MVSYGNQMTGLLLQQMNDVDAIREEKKKNEDEATGLSMERYMAVIDSNTVMESTTHLLNIQQTTPRTKASGALKNLM